jgi:four helix bundle protein
VWVKDFRELAVWQKAHALTLVVYDIPRRFPSEEKFGLTSQMRRAAASVPTNIAEGCGRNSDPELARFLELSMGSASEVEYQLILARDLSYLEDSHWRRLSEDVCEIERMLAAFIKRIRTSG